MILHHVLEGTGPAVLLLHSTAADARQWRPQIRELRGEVTVVYGSRDLACFRAVADHWRPDCPEPSTSTCRGPAISPTSSARPRRHS
ncbi:alpha/beta fold hydrolase [Jatrophihabitans lederbergiae]|uniref:Uncharacterized protein n=1 Tax=Jatrophihabitans lederbergiae TaxID=3075547 RepID=A0ABU2JGZ5_9ACTN|nr:hypothetical protein [Jatrophihabitans sp. DSM 44399]MDT0263513.1 hypothetical protein [Jatrophihabitans sp. DSM 44399]